MACASLLLSEQILGEGSVLTTEAASPTSVLRGSNDTWYLNYEYQLDETAKRIILTKYKINLSTTVPAKATIDGIEYSTVLSGDVFYNKRNNFTSISFENGVKLVGDVSKLFCFCGELTNLDLSGLDTSEATNMDEMFYCCGNLTELDVSHFDTSKVTSMREMFRYLENIKTLDVSGFDTSNVTDMSGMFWGCQSLENLDVSGFNTSKVTRMDDMFSQIPVTKLDLSNFNTSKVTSMSYMFCWSDKLTKLDLSNFDTSSLVGVSCMFHMATGLQEVNLSNFDTSKVNNMNNMFGGCESLEYLDLTSFDTSKVVQMSFTFWNCKRLRTIRVSDKWVINSLLLRKDESGMGGPLDDLFTNCENLIGQNGTTYDENHVDVEYAHIDMPGNPGYLTGVSSQQEVTPEPAPAATYSISGSVTGLKNKGVPGTKITAGGITVHAQKDGTFSIQGLSNGEYTVKATHGNASATQQVIINGKDVTGLVMDLSKGTLEAAPVISGWTDTTITITPQEGYEYNACPGSVWNETGSIGWRNDGQLSGLQAQTVYTVVARDAEAGAVSAGIVVTTNASPAVQTKTLPPVAYGKGEVIPAVTDEGGNSEITLGNIDANLIDQVLDEDERAAVKNGKTLVICVTSKRMDAAEVPAAEKAGIETVLHELSQLAQIGCFLDLNLYKNIGGAGNRAIKDIPGGQALLITIPVPTNMRPLAGFKRIFFVIRFHNGKAEVVSKAENATEIGFRADGFSTYALTYMDEKPPATAEGTQTAGGTQNTSVISAPWTAGSSSSGSSQGDSPKTFTAGKGGSRAYYEKTGKGKAAYMTCAASRKTKAVSVPATIKCSGKTLKVTVVKAYAFTGKDQLQKVSIGKNITKIEGSAFLGCDRLSVLEINSKKLKKTGVKKCLDGSGVKKVLVPDEKKTLYRKIFAESAAGGKKGVKVKAQ